MIDEVLRLVTLASSVMASSAFMLALVIGIGGTVERASAGCYACLEGPSIRALAKPPERSPVIQAAVLQPVRR